MGGEGYSVRTDKECDEFGGNEARFGWCGSGLDSRRGGVGHGEEGCDTLGDVGKSRSGEGGQGGADDVSEGSDCDLILTLLADAPPGRRQESLQAAASNRLAPWKTRGILGPYGSGPLTG